MSAANASGDFEQLRLEPGMVVQELGWDDDVDEDLRDQIMDAIDDDMVDEVVDPVDMVLLWHRTDDGDVADALVDAVRDLGTDGVVWMMTPKIGREGFVEPADINEGADVAGLKLTKTAEVSPDWQAYRVVRPRSAR